MRGIGHLAKNLIRLQSVDHLAGGHRLRLPRTPALRGLHESVRDSNGMIRILEEH